MDLIPRPLALKAGWPPIQRLDGAALSDAAINKLAESGISPTSAAAARVFSVTNARAEIDPEFLALPALAFPFFCIEGNPMTFNRDGIAKPFLRVRYLVDSAGKQGGPPKYMSFRGAGVRPYFAHSVGIDWRAVASNTTLPIAFTEGELKALKACSMRIPTIGLSGVDCFSVKALKQ